MEQRIKEHENFITKASKHPDRDISLYHHRMVRYFQHERSIHLAITLFFSALTLILIAITTYLTVWYAEIWYTFIPLYLATLILIILSAAYVRHYYFLENHIQRLYDYTYDLHIKSKN